jgi:hypothetical protein
MKKYYLLFIFCLAILSSCLPVFSCEKWIKKEIMNMDINGIVIKKEKSSSCHGRLIVRSEIKIDTLENLCYCGGNIGFWDEININDSISKPVGYKQIIIKRNGELKVYDYPCCDH